MTVIWMEAVMNMITTITATAESPQLNIVSYVKTEYCSKPRYFCAKEYVLDSP